jgi:imidazolonepropionase-like amidohydrolase
MKNDLLIKNATYLNVAEGRYETGDIKVVGGSIAEIGENLPANGAGVIDAEKKFVLPGLIDCHVHVTAATADLGQLGEWSPNYAALNTARLMGNMLDRGFTTVRDTAGADFGLHDAQAEGLLRGPRLFFGGKALSQTGGHADPRPRGRNAHDGGYCCPHIGRLADGVDAVRQAARDELRKGAHHIKIMAGGGVASPTDRIDSTQYSLSEIEAVVEEAEAANRYVTAHAYTGRAINRALRAGVRGIEHGNLLDDESLELFKEFDAFLTMNLVTYWALEREGRKFGLSQENWEKVAAVLDGGYEALGKAHAAGINLAYGSDLLGGMQVHQAKEFAIRGKVQPAIDVIRSATTTAAALLQREGELGTIAKGACGDFVITAEDPLKDLAVLADTQLEYVIQGGAVVKSAFPTAA